MNKFTYCRCVWPDYYDFRIIIGNGIGHCRVSVFSDEVIISDLFVKEEYRNQGYGTKLLNKAETFVPEGREISILPLYDWQKEWYTKRGYKIMK